MGPLLLLTSILLSGWTTAQTTFIIQSVTLTVEPSAKLQRDANATLRCRAEVSVAQPRPLSRVYTLFKDGTVVYTKTTSSSEDLLYAIPGVRVSNTGKYMCLINIAGQEASSMTTKLTVTGLIRPQLQVDKEMVHEGTKVTARCLAPEESGSIIFYFYADSNELREERVTSDRVEVTMSFMGAGMRHLSCDYDVVLMPTSVRSQKSYVVQLTINDLSFAPVLDMTPGQKVFEGDKLSLTCSLSGDLQDLANASLFLTHKLQVLGEGHTSINRSLVVFAKHSGEFECILKMGNVKKTATKILSVIELFSAPRLSMAQSEVFQGELLLLTCHSEVLVAEQLRQQDIVYTMHPNVSQREVGRFSGRMLLSHYNYSCIAQARGIQKTSQTLLVMPKVSVIAPKIWAVGQVVLGKPFEIQCVSERGSLPINYTLWRNNKQLNASATVSQRGQQALFNVTVQQAHEVGQFMCEADNSQSREGVFSKRLDASVIVPLSQATLTVVPGPADVSEGNTLILICGVTGTPPVTFKWYRTDRSQPLSTSTTTNQVSLDHQIPRVGGDDSAIYYCEALNLAQNPVKSQWVAVEVRMALWKKGVIAAACLLVLCMAVLACVLRYKTSRGKKEVATELSVKPSSSKSDDSLTVSLTHDTEVYTAATDAALRYDGTEGRATNGTADSVAASLPADISNRSSDSIPATV